jgi:hypothetical protein
VLSISLLLEAGEVGLEGQPEVVQVDIAPLLSVHLLEVVEPLKAFCLSSLAQSTQLQ